MVQTTTDVLFEFYDATDTPTRRHILSLDEAGKDEAAASLANKLYEMIVKRVEDIDYGTIPASKGDITKIAHFAEMKECLDTIRGILNHFNQKTDQVDTLDKAIQNFEDSKKTWEKAFAIQAELPCIFYNNMVLSIVTGVSLLISSSIEFIKDPTNSTFSISFDKVGYLKTKDKLLFKNLEKFNKAYAKGDIVKLMDSINKSQRNVGESAFPDMIEESMSLAVIAGALTLTGTVVTLLSLVIPILHELTCLFFNMKQNISDYYDLQSQLVRFNAEQLKYDYTKTDAEIKKIYNKQIKIADRFKKMSNLFAVKINKAERGISKINEDKLKIPVEDTNPTSSSIF